MDFLFDIMATFFDFPSYGTNLATNSTSYNDSYTSTLCVVYNITVSYYTGYYTSSTPSRISSRSTTLFNDPIIHSNCVFSINRSSFRTSIRLTFLMASYNLVTDYHQLVIATNSLVPCKLTSRGTTSTSYLPTDTFRFGDSP